MNKRNFESIDNLLAGYVGGSLPYPVKVLVEAHLQMTPRSRPLVHDLERAAGTMLEDTAPIALKNRDNALDAIFASREPATKKAEAPRSATMPAALRNFVGYDIDTIPWRSVMPGFKEFNLEDDDGCHVSMFWIKPGRTVPAHTHEGFEISLILEGAFHDARGRFGEGDISIADQSVDHRPTAENECPCIGFAVTDAPLRLTGSLYRRIGDIIGAG